MKCPHPQKYKQKNKLSPHAFKVYFFTVIVGSGKTQILEILVTFSATISFKLYPCWRKNWECIRLNWFVIILSLKRLFRDKNSKAFRQQMFSFEIAFFKA